MTRAMTGIVYGIGVGPGDPDLLTLKALRLIRACPVLAYPALEQGDSLARAIVAPHLADFQPIEYPIRLPMNPDPAPARLVYDQASFALAEHLALGRDVAILCQGDPFFYGSFMYLFQRLSERHTIEVVPGVSSLTACAAALGTPLAGRDEVLTIIPAPLPEEELAARLQATDAAAIIKLGRHFGKVRRVLDRLGLGESCRYVERATLPEQMIRSLASVDETCVPYFAMILMRRGAAERS
jgi:precorrin-2/cobalt-factor-2 C20-methyltransferase